ARSWWPSALRSSLRLALRVLRFAALGRLPHEHGAGLLHVVVGEAPPGHDEPVFVGGLEGALDAAVALDVGMGLHGDVGAHEALEVGRRTERALEPRARHLERVAPGNRVVTVE